MTKKTVFLLWPCALANALIFSLTAYASPVGNTADVKTLHGPGVFSLKETRNISVETSFDADVVLKRDLTAGDVTNAQLKNSAWYMFKVGYKMFDRIEPYIRFGGASLQAKWTDIGTGEAVNFYTSSNWAWGLGIKGLIYEFKNPKIKIIGDGSYRTADLNGYKGYVNGDATTISVSDSRFIIREWQAALLAATEIDLGKSLSQFEGLKEYKLVPYGGIKYSEVSGILRMVVNSTNIYHPDNIKSDKNIGLVVGCDLAAPGDYVSLNIEGRFIDETAVSGGLAMLF